MRDNIINHIIDKKIIAIIRGVYEDDCVKLAQALYAGGIDIMEITFDQSIPIDLDKTFDTLIRVKSIMGNKVVLGAGTVTSEHLLEMAYRAGAGFIVSPDTNDSVIRRTVELGLVSIPGAMTPSEIISAHNAGADFVKIFPASNLGPSYFTAIRGPINHIRLLAVGGINERNLEEFIKKGAVGVGIGGSLIKKEWIREGKFNEITSLAHQIVLKSII